MKREMENMHLTGSNAEVLDYRIILIVIVIRSSCCSPILQLACYHR